MPLSPTRIASVSSLKAAFRYFSSNPKGRMEVAYGEYWSFSDFRRWFTRCLFEKINARDPRAIAAGKWRKCDPDYQAIMRRDARIINEYAQRIRNSGRNLLGCRELKARYPHVDHQMVEC